MTIPREIERKFLVRSEAWRSTVSAATTVTQGYLSRPGDVTVRVRRIGDEATLAIKVRDGGPGKAELEYGIPVSHAEFLLASACERPPVKKTRHRVPYGGQSWVVDVFEGPNSGLVMAEIELPDPHSLVAIPYWAGDEVTADRRFSNASLYRNPYGEWWDLPRIHLSP